MTDAGLIVLAAFVSPFRADRETARSLFDDGEFVEAMDIRIGGRLGPDPRFGEVVVKKVPHWELNETLLRIFDLYEQHHDGGETFRDFAGRTDPQWWAQELAPVEDPVA